MAIRPAFLVIHGSFNPVHRQHLEMVVQARQTLEAVGFTVVRGILAITPSRRISSKGSEAVTDEHRLAALQLGCDAVGPCWLVPEARGLNFGSGWQLIKGLSPELLAEEPNATIFKVIGADTAGRYSNELKGPTVVVCREGSAAALECAIRKAGRKPGNDFFVVSQLPGEECSSTKLRTALQVEDTRAVQKMCPDPVSKYLLANREVLYGSSELQRGDEGASGSPDGSKAAAGYPIAGEHAAAAPAPVLKTGAMPVPAANRGGGMTAEALRELWSQKYGRQDVLGFYGHGAKAGDYACFSNFFDQSREPFDFVLPVEMCGFALDEKDRVVSCTFSEKAIMLCKAAAMADRQSFGQIKLATTPAATKELGRWVENFDEALWGRLVCSVAVEVVYQKFAKTPSIRHILLGTGDMLIAEATRNDRNWGIGIDVGDPRVQSPTQWRGSNILGWALMEVRTALNGSGVVAASHSEAATCSETTAAPPPAKAKRWGKKSNS